MEESIYKLTGLRSSRGGSVLVVPTLRLPKNVGHVLSVRNPVDREHSFWLNVNTNSGSS